MLKVLFIAPAGVAYGSERSLLGLLTACSSIVSEVVCPPGSPLCHEVRSLGIRTYELAFGKYAFARRPDWHFVFLIRVARILLTSSPDVIVINLEGNTPWFIVAALAAGIPVVRFCRFELKPPVRWIDRAFWCLCSAILCPSDCVRRQVFSWLPEDLHSRVYLLYNPQKIRDSVSTADTMNKSREFDSRPSSPMIICVIGRLHRGKRIETAIRAFHAVYNEISNVELHIVGDHDHSISGQLYATELAQLVTDLGIRHCVRFLGYFQDVYSPLASCSVCVLTSESESFGRVLVEAWACAVPTVASDSGGCRELTLASHGGLLAPVGNHQEFASRILSLLRDSGFSAECGRRGKEWVRNNCDPLSYANKFTNIVLSTVSAKH